MARKAKNKDDEGKPAYPYKTIDEDGHVTWHVDPNVVLAIDFGEQYDLPPDEVSRLADHFRASGINEDEDITPEGDLDTDTGAGIT